MDVTVDLQPVEDDNEVQKSDVLLRFQCHKRISCELWFELME